MRILSVLGSVILALSSKGMCLVSLRVVRFIFAAGLLSLNHMIWF